MALLRQNAISKAESRALTRLKMLNSRLNKDNKKLKKELAAARKRVNALALARKIKRRIKLVNTTIPSVRTKVNRQRRILNLSR
jgi:hypothetical protein